jgi:hypothetical protein
MYEGNIMRILTRRPIFFSPAIAALLAVHAILCQPVASGQTITTIAGTGESTNNGDRGRALKINIGDPFGVEYSSAGELHICEVRNHRVWLLDGQGDVHVIAGSGKKGYSGDGGPATAAELNEPYEVRFDSAGNVLFVEMQNQLVRKVDRQTGKISTVAGTGKKGFGGDGGPAKEATLDGPKGIAIGPDNNIYVADTENNVIRRIDANSGIISTIAGRGPKHKGAEGDGGPATAASMNRPHGICVAADGAVIIGDTLTNRVRQVK